MGLGFAGALGAGGVVDAMHVIEAERLLKEKLARDAQQQAFERSMKFQEGQRAQQQVDILKSTMLQNRSKLAGEITGKEASTDFTKSATAENLRDTAQKKILDARRNAALTGMDPRVAAVYDVGDRPNDPFDVTGEIKYTREHAGNLERDRLNNAAAMARAKEAASGIGRGQYTVTERNAQGEWVVRRYDQADNIIHESPLAPTVGERNTARSYQKAQPVITAIGSLSERINTQQGVFARITGVAERAAAKVNLDNDVAEYEALVQSFTPILARALGHTGVLTQQDVDSAREILPKPTDSKALRDRKIARVTSLFADIEAVDTGQPPKKAEDIETVDPKTGRLARSTATSGGGRTVVRDASGRLVPQGATETDVEEVDPATGLLRKRR